MNDRPLSVKEQAARMILGEIAPLVERVEEVTALAKDSHELLAADVTQLAAVVTTFEKTVKGACEEFSYLISQARTVQTTIARFENEPEKQAAKPFPTLLLAALTLGSALVAALMTAGAVLFIERDTAEQARVGRVVSRAYQHLDADTRKKVDAAIQKADKQ